MLLASSSKSEIIRLKDLFKSDRLDNRLTITHETYLGKVITKFGMKEAKSINLPLAAHLNLSTAYLPKTEKEISKMGNIFYANVIGSVKFFMITIRPDLAYAITFLSKFKSYLGNPHWAWLKWLL